MRKQANPFQVRWVVLESGERLPMLRERATGVPLYEPTLYALTELRAKNLASATIDRSLRAVMILCFFLLDQKIDLDERMLNGHLLTLPEIEKLARWCRLTVDDMVENSVNDETELRQPSRVASLERARMRKSSHATRDEVGADTAGTRGLYVVAYLSWLVRRRLLGIKQSAARLALSASSSTAIEALREHLPSKRWRDAGTARKGFTEEIRHRILEVINPVSPGNPWTGYHCRLRNELIVRWLLHLGLRRGELLGVQTSGIDFQSNEVTIERRADDAGDPRRDEPNTKTYARLLPLSDEMAALARNYILKVRSRLKGARRHKYLLVANGSGAPLSKAAFSKIFESLQESCPELKGVHPHLFRHTWNDDFSEQMDREKVGEEREKTMRSMLMGWSLTSGTAATYTRRHVERKANEVSLRMQRKSMKDQTA